MYDLFFGNNAAWYTIPAIIGTAFFTVRMLMLLLGAGHLGLDLHGDVSVDAHGDPSDSTHSFEILSIQSIAAFVMGFGWAGLAGLKGTQWSFGVVNLVAAACGIGMVWLLAMLLRGMTDLETTGTIAIGSAIGREGDVYVTVPGDSRGRGQVRITIDNRQRIYDAITSGQDLPTGTRIRVVSTNDDNSVSVSPA